MQDDDVQNRGRPSKPEQLRIREKIRECFEKGLSSFTAAKVTGYDIKTVNKYYNEFYQEIKNSTSQDFIQRCKEEKEQAIIAIENEILQSCKIRDDLEKDIKKMEKKSKPENWVYKRRIEISRHITNLQTLRVTLAISPTADITLKKMLGEFLSNNGGLEALIGDGIA